MNLQEIIDNLCSGTYGVIDQKIIKRLKNLSQINKEAGKCALLDIIGACKVGNLAPDSIIEVLQVLYIKYYNGEARNTIFDIHTTACSG